MVHLPFQPWPNIFLNTLKKPPFFLSSFLLPLAAASSPWPEVLGRCFAAADAAGDFAVDSGPAASPDATLAPGALSAVGVELDVLGRPSSAGLACRVTSSSEPATVFGFGGDGSELSFLESAALREASRA